MQYNDVLLMSLLKGCFINNITTSLERLLNDVVCKTFLQRHDIVERRPDVTATAIQRRYEVVCLQGMGQLQEMGAVVRNAVKQFINNKN